VAVTGAHPTLGRYTLEARIAQGGMAAVFLGRMAGPGGFSKKVVVKRILPEHAANPTFVEMFLSEARLAALLNHPNVVQVYDFGQDQGQYYLAMELIDGVSVRALQYHYRRRNEWFPPRLAAFIMSQACAGLAYAHALKDDAGRPLNLVHRDVSPDNLLVSRAGVVKLVDFGVARVASATVQTTAGIVKGKLAYMAPEQVSAQEIDHRVDLYAAGVALFELIAGRRPFVAANDLELAMTIVERPAPALRELAPEASVELEAICARALEKHREQRFPDARALQGALDDFLGSTKDLAAELEAVVSQTSHEQGDPTSVQTPLGPGRSSDEPADTGEPVTTPSEAGRRRRLTSVLIGISIVVAVLVGLVAGRLLYERGPEQVPETVGVPRHPEPPPEPTPASSPAPEAAAPAPEPEARSPEPEPAAASNEPAPRKHKSVAGEGLLTLRTSPWCEVTLDGTVAGTTPLVKLKVAAGSHTLQLANEKVGLQTKVTLIVAPGQSLVKALTFPVGQVSVKAPAGTKVFHGSELLGVAPLGVVTLVAGKQTLGIVDPSGRFSTRMVTVPANGAAELSLP
jgi:serine/threonine-protein kinase